LFVFTFSIEALSTIIPQVAGRKQKELQGTVLISDEIICFTVSLLRKLLNGNVGGFYSFV